MPAIILAAHGRITTYFHQQLPGKSWKHRGIDQGHTNMTPYDLQIMAPADGVVTCAGPFGSYGNVIYIKHDDGWVSVLAHHYKQHVTKDDRVAQGQIIAVMGNTGTKYVHSHQELRDARANQLDPLLHVGAMSATSGTTNTPIKKDGFLMALSDDEQAELLNIARENHTLLAQIHDAVFLETPTSRGSSAGLLRSTGRLEVTVKSIYDALFIETPTSRGTPGGVLVNQRVLLERLPAAPDA